MVFPVRNIVLSQVLFCLWLEKLSVIDQISSKIRLLLLLWKGGRLCSCFPALPPPTPTQRKAFPYWFPWECLLSKSFAHGSLSQVSLFFGLDLRYGLSICLSISLF